MVSRDEYLTVWRNFLNANNRAARFARQLDAANQLNNRLVARLETATQTITRLNADVNQLQSMVTVLIAMNENLHRQGVTYDGQQLDGLSQIRNRVQVVDLDQQHQIDDLTQKRDELLRQRDGHETAIFTQEDLINEITQERDQLREQLHAAGLLQ